MGWRVHLLKGGYKAFRRQVLDQLTELPSHFTFRVLAGLTGTGKTRLLDALRRSGAQVLDLEGLANHRGSLLGANPGKDQPGQKAFDTALWTALRRFEPDRPIFVEAESSRIGSLHLPPALWDAVTGGTVLLVTLPMSERIALLLEDYPHLKDDPQTLKNLLDAFRALRGHQLVNRWHQQIAANDWESFLQSILRDHYDLAYRAAGAEGSAYQTPRTTLALSARPSEAGHSLSEHERSILLGEGIESGSA